MTTTVTALAQDIALARETDYYLMTEQLTEDELGLLYRVRKFAETEILPIVNPYWERGEFPFELVPKIAAQNIVGDAETLEKSCIFSNGEQLLVGNDNHGVH